MIASASSRQAPAFRSLRAFPAAAVAVAVSAVLVAVATGGKARAQSANFDHEGLAKQSLESHIRPGYDKFKGTADALKSTLDEACKAHDAKAADKVKAAFRDTVLAWSAVEHLKIGPIVDNNRHERILFWPDRQKIGERQVQQIIEKLDPAALTVAGLQGKSVAVQGLTALEVLLYAKAPDIYLADTAEAKFACGYAAAIAQNVAAIASDVVAAWGRDGSMTALWLKPSDQNPLYKASNGPTAELVKLFHGGISNVRDGKLLSALGLKKTSPKGPLAPKSKAPFDISGLAVASVIANLEGALDLYEKGGLAQRLAVTEKETAALIKSELQAAIGFARDAAPAGVNAFNDKDATTKLIGMGQPLATAAIAGSEALANSAGLVIGFTADDGD